MPRVNYIPPATQWSFSITRDQLPFSIAVPVGADAGEIVFTAMNGSGSTPINPEGAVGHVSFDGDPDIDTACLTVGGESIPVPSGTLTIDISATFGCNAGPDETLLIISGGN